MSDQAREPCTHPKVPKVPKVLEAIRAVLSDNPSYERGLASPRELVDQVAREEGPSGLCDLTVALSLELAEALERLAPAQGVTSLDLVEVWFAS